MLFNDFVFIIYVSGWPNYYCETFFPGLFLVFFFIKEHERNIKHMEKRYYIFNTRALLEMLLIYSFFITVTLLMKKRINDNVFFLNFG